MDPPQWQPKGTKNWEVCSICLEPLSDDKRYSDYLCYLDCKRYYSRFLSFTTMRSNWEPSFVYQRRRQHANSAAKSSTEQSGNTEPNDDSGSSIFSESPTPSSLQGTVSITQTATEARKSCTVHPVGHDSGDAGSFEGRLAADRTSSVEAMRSNGSRVLNDPCVKDNCSSSKSILEFSSASLKTDLVNTGESSCSGKLISENVPDEMSQRDKSISILGSLGFLDRVCTRKEEVASETNDDMKYYYSRSCKVCKLLDSTANMLICDDCEDAFHVCCSNLRIQSIPVEEWLCGSCLRKNRKLSREKKASGNSNTEEEPYVSKVRVGDEFQASVPAWSGMMNSESELASDLLELHPGNHIPKQERISTMPLKSGATGNWLQCRQVMTGIGKDIDGDICGKWRRAPLFEVQSDKWECFDSVLWDPVHADCAVPQELETIKIMRQLDLLEALKPVQSSPPDEPAAKIRKLDSPKSNGS